MTTIYVNVDDRHIMSATDDDAILLGYADGLHSLDPCIVYVPRKVYLDALGAWLNRKAEYNKRYVGDWCGVGNILFNGEKSNDVCHIAAHLIGEIDDAGEDALAEYVDVPMYRAEAFDIDMEHG